MKYWLAFCSFGLLVACAAPPAKLDMVTTSSSVVVTIAPDIVVEIDARIELLAGIQAWTTWTASDAQGDPGWFPPAYYHELKSFFGPYRLSEAVRIVQKLQDLDFKYQGPPTTLLLCRDGLAFTPPTDGFGPALSQDAHGEQNLNDLVAACRQLASDSQFNQFFVRHQPYYQALLSRLCQDLPAQSISDWFISYFGGTDRIVFHYVLSPAMMPAGGYGIALENHRDNQPIRHMYQIVRLADKADGKYLRDLGLHEFSHSFVSTSGFISAAARPALEKLYAPVRAPMTAIGYSTLESYLNELIIHAIEIRAHVDLGFISANAIDQQFDYMQSQGFTGTDFIYQILDDYSAQRERYPDFTSFMPVLLERLAEQANPR